MRIAVAIAGLSLVAQDPREIIEKCLQRDRRHDELARQYAYLETAAEQEWKGGTRTKSETETHEIISLYGQPYRRLVAKNGKPLTAQEQKKEQEKIDKLAAERAKETAEQRERRLAKYAEDRRRQRSFVQEIPKAYSFQMAGETTVGGRPAWIVDATPLASFRPRDTRERMLTKFKGRFYISKLDSTLLKIEAEAIDTVSFGLVLARLSRGARFSMEQARVNDELWMPLRIKVDFDARLALFKRMRIDVQIDYSDFRKFQSESKVLPISPLEK
ncbi:MAG: hypothetical protein HYX27_00425 [Acidobacteria bacterium]|nr:hypothetical protein [Acidobacteriota bacterium]